MVKQKIIWILLLRWRPMGQELSHSNQILFFMLQIISSNIKYGDKILIASSKVEVLQQFYFNNPKLAPPKLSVWSTHYPKNSFQTWFAYSKVTASIPFSCLDMVTTSFFRLFGVMLSKVSGFTFRALLTWLM